MARFEEPIATIRALWNSGGELVTRDSPFFPPRDAVFELPPTATSGQTFGSPAPGRACCGHRRYGDGWFPAAMTFRPKDYAAGLEKVLAAASDAGRDPVSFTAAGLFFVMTGRSRDEVDEALGSQPMRAFALDAPAEIWVRRGSRHPLGDDFTGARDIIPQALEDRPSCP